MRTAGFAPLIFVIITAIATVAIGGGGYGVYKYKMTAKENASLRAQVESQKNTQQEESQEKTEEQVSEENKVATTSEITAQEEPKSEEPAKEIIYINQPPVESTAQRQAEIDEAVQKALADKEKESTEAQVPFTEEEPILPKTNDPIKVLNLAQTSFPDSYGGVYGAYKLAIEVTPEGGDILIPPTTSDTLGSRIIGFTYTVSGEFKGIQNSEVDCGGLMSSGYCKIKDGTTKILYAQVWIYPDKDSNGNYSVTFKKIRYLFNGVEKEININKESETLNLYY